MRVSRVVKSETVHLIFFLQAFSYESRFISARSILRHACCSLQTAPGAVRTRRKRGLWMFLADLFTLYMNIGSGFFSLAIDIGKDRAFADLLAITISLAGYTITYNLIDFLVILGISIIAAVIVEKLMHQSTPGGFFGAFLIALIGIWLFITFVPLTWNQDVKVPTTHIPLITSFIGAVLSILIVHFFTALFRRGAVPRRA
jgi:uncharacterized membrane protein YeaQ/YmgE (transglycosylase-associated protein family)